MYSKKNDLIRKDIQSGNETNTNIEKNNNLSIPIEEINQQSELLIINKDVEPKTNYRYFQKEIYINDNNKKTALMKKKPIYTKVRSDSYKPTSINK